MRKMILSREGAPSTMVTCPSGLAWGWTSGHSNPRISQMAFGSPAVSCTSVAQSSSMSGLMRDCASGGSGWSDSFSISAFRCRRRSVPGGVLNKDDLVYRRIGSILDGRPSRCVAVCRQVGLQARNAPVRRSNPRAVPSSGCPCPLVIHCMAHQEGERREQRHEVQGQRDRDMQKMVEVEGLLKRDVRISK